VVACLQVLKRRMSERKDDMEHCVLLLRKHVSILLICLGAVCGCMLAGLEASHV